MEYSGFHRLAGAWLSVLLLCHGTAFAAWEPAVAISAAGQDANLAKVAFDGKGNALAVWTRPDGSNLRVEAAARPAGGTFAAATALSAAGQDASDPQVAFDKKGNALAVWRRSDGTNDRIEAGLRPFGGSFGVADIISAAGEDAVFPQIAVDSKRNALAVWMRSEGSIYRIEAAFRPADGTFGPADVISGAGATAQFPQVAFDKKGNALVVFEHSDGTDLRIEAAFRPRGGSFGPAAVISAAGAPAQFPHVAFDKKGNALAAWVRFDGIHPRVEAAFRPVGGSFAPADVLSTAGGDGGEPAVAFDKKGNALVVWRLAMAPDQWIEAALRPRDATFGAPDVISDPDESADDPTVVFDRKGNALAVWERYDGSNLRIEAALRPRTGSFGAADIISAPGQLAEFPDIAFDKKGNALAVWERSDGTNFRIEAAFRPKD
jgi:hypothetical protein